MAHLSFSDMMSASTLSRRGNRCAQVYATDFGWTRAFPMALRSEAHKTLPWLYARNGVLPAFNSFFPFKVSWVVLVFCLLSGLVWLSDTTFTLSVGSLFSMYWARKTITALKSLLSCLDAPLLWHLLWTTCHT